MARRLKTFKPASIRTGGAAIRIHLLDVSASGALAHGTAPPKGAWVTLLCEGIERAAVIAWTRGPRFGLAFVHPLSDCDLQAVCG